MSKLQVVAQSKSNYYIGLMSGTSADGIDLALVSFNNDGKLSHHASFYQPYSDEITTKITALYCATTHDVDNSEIDRAFSLDIELAKLFAKAIEQFLQQEQLSHTDIIAIGNHGQTIRHRPLLAQPFTLQIGCCQTLATLTNIRVVGQFRRKDMALGGQGAPLVPAFHQTIFRETASDDKLTTGCDVFVVNIGGITNITFLPASKSLSVIGYDTGTGNALLDDWFKLHHPQCKHNYDKNGDWAAKGKLNPELLTHLLADDYFQLSPPKSTGREYFNLPWLEKKLAHVTLDNTNLISAQDIQATLAAFTAITLVDAIAQHHLANEENKSTTKVYLCGGGVHNKYLKGLIDQQLKLHPKKYELLLTNQKGIDADQLEAIAFAWFAFAYDKKLLSSMPAVTGASKSCTLGNVYFP